MHELLLWVSALVVILVLVLVVIEAVPKVILVEVVLIVHSPNVINDN
jgi:hypothetical protein